MQPSNQAQTGKGGSALDNRLAFSIADFVAATGLGRTSVYEAIRSGDLVARKFGKRTIIYASDAQTFLERLPKVRGA